jgi:hypothetical protein
MQSTIYLPLGLGHRCLSAVFFTDVGPIDATDVVV